MFIWASLPPGVNGEQLAHTDGPGVQQAFETLLLKAVRDR